MTIPLPTAQALDQIRISSPCRASWEEMRGDDRVRFCANCRQNVYNLSEMTTDETIKLVNQHEALPCVRFYMRRDGTAITKDCQVGWRWLVWKRLRRRAGLAASIFSILFMAACGMGPPVRTKEVYSVPPKADQKKSDQQPESATQPVLSPETGSDGPTKLQQ